MTSTPHQFDWSAIRRRLDAGAAALHATLAPDQGRLQQTYRQRAEQYAQCRALAAERPEIERVLVFRLGAERYGAELSAVIKVLPLGSCTPVPAAPHELLGVANVAGEIVSVVDAATLLGLPVAQDRNAGYILLVRHAGKATGLRVDGVESIAEIAPRELSRPNDDDAAPAIPCVAGIAPGRLIVLNVRQLLSHPIFQSACLEH